MSSDSFSNFSRQRSYMLKTFKLINNAFISSKENTFLFWGGNGSSRSKETQFQSIFCTKCGNFITYADMKTDHKTNILCKC
jgi:hypothetical protein